MSEKASDLPSDFKIDREKKDIQILLRGKPNTLKRLHPGHVNTSRKWSSGEILGTEKVLIRKVYFQKKDHPSLIQRGGEYTARDERTSQKKKKRERGRLTFLQKSRGRREQNTTSKGHLPEDNRETDKKVGNKEVRKGGNEGSVTSKEGLIATKRRAACLTSPKNAVKTHLPRRGIKTSAPRQKGSLGQR